MNIKLPDFTNANVLVFGDVMLDRYWYGDTARISPEAPVPVVHVNEVEERPGGAGNVALNISTLGVQTTLYSMCDDAIANTLEHQLIAAGIKPYFQRIADMPTITKLRVLSLNQQLIRLDFEEAFHAISNQVLIEQCIADMQHAGALIISDYNKGSVQDTHNLIKAAKAQGIPILIDPKSNDFSVYQQASIITPNLKEFEAVVGTCKDETMLIERAYSLIKTHALDALLITRGARGMTLVTQSEPVLHLPTHAQDVYDVTGAGDTVIGVLAAGLAAGMKLPDATTLANIAAGIAVGKIGAATVALSELQCALEPSTSFGQGIVDENKLQNLIKEAQAQGEKVVMTNGCFDLLHAGHVMYLEQAKALGDKLIVAVNSDESVKRLKGDNRPINTEQRRMEVLSGLSAVDWVYPLLKILLSV